MDIGVEIMNKRNKKFTEQLEQRRALCDTMSPCLLGAWMLHRLQALRIASNREGLPR